MATETSFDGAVLGMGNPLLDISANVEMEFCEKYGVTMNNAILAEEKHFPLYGEIVAAGGVEYIAGGATQNSMRVAQWVSDHDGMTSIVGCVGDNDEYCKALETAAAADGVRTAYLKDTTAGTGTCAVLIHKHERSLVANLSAANNYKIDHFHTPEIQELVKKARVFYSSGFFLTVSPDTMVECGKHAAATGKTYMLNLAAPFLSAVFKDQMASVMPYADFVFGNESEGKAWGEANGMPDASLGEIGLAIAALPKASGTHPRTVIITQGADPTLLCREGKVTEFAVDPIPEAEMVDFNGAGDAFVGGFIAKFVDGASLEDAIKCGCWAARHIIKRSGCTFDASERYVEA